MREARPENLGERFGDPGGPDPGEATSSAASASSMRERAAQELSPEMGRMGAEDLSRAFRTRLYRRAACNPYSAPYFSCT